MQLDNRVQGPNCLLQSHKTAGCAWHDQYVRASQLPHDRRCCSWASKQIAQPAAAACHELDMREEREGGREKTVCRTDDSIAAFIRAEKWQSGVEGWGGEGEGG